MSDCPEPEPDDADCDEPLLFFFDEELLKDIAKKLMRSYNVKVEVADSLRNKRFYGSFGISGNTIDKILDVMASTQQMNYKYENGVYILY